MIKEIGGKETMDIKTFDKSLEDAELKTFDKILADAKAEAETNKRYTNSETLGEICMDCGIDYIN